MNHAVWNQRPHVGRTPLLNVLSLSIALALSGHALVASGAAPGDADSTSKNNSGCESTEGDDKNNSLIGCVSVTGKIIPVANSGALGVRSLLDTPFSVSAVSSKELESRQAYSLTDVFANDASVSRSVGGDYTAWTSSMSVRGLPIDFASGLKMNGMPMWSFGVNMPVEFMEQVQLLKGATGFMYGFGAPGGTINYVTKKAPAADRLAAVDVGFRSDEIFTQHADLGGRFGNEGRYGYRFNASNEQGDTASGSNIDRKAAAVSLEAQVTPDVLVTADVLYQDNMVERPAPYYFLTSYTSPKLPSVPDSDYNPSSDDTYFGSEFFTAALGVNWQFAPDWKIGVTVNRFETDLWYSQEYLTLTNDGGDYLDRTYDSLQYINFDYAQALLQGEFATGRIEHQLVGGIFYLKYEAFNGYSNLVQGYVNPGNGNIYSDARLSYSTTYNRGQPDYKALTETQRAVFLSDTVKFSDAWSLLAGARYTDYSKDSFGYAFTSPTVFTKTTRNYDKSPITPTVALLFKPAPEATVYASYTEALEQGGTVSPIYANANQVLDPLTSKQYEVGVKWATPTWGTSAAVFRIDRAAEYANTNNFYVQDGNLRYLGFEVDGNVRATDNLTLGASALYLDDATYKETGAAWLIGRRVPGSTRFSATVEADYAIAGVPGLSLRADAKYLGSTTVFQNTGLQRTLTTDDRTIVNLGVNYRTDVNGYGLTLHGGVQNALDEKYWAGGANNVFVGSPRVAIVNARIDF